MARVAPVSLQIKNVTNATFSKLNLLFLNALENKRVEAIVGPRI
jgi:hypothetical protein